MQLYLVRGLPDATLSGQRDPGGCPRIFKNATLSGRQMPLYLYRYCTAAGEISGRGALTSKPGGGGRAKTPLAKAERQLRSPVQLVPPMQRFC